MRLSQLDLNLLVVFDAIASEGSLTRAAQQLHLSQPAISHALARLRDALADPLFVRRGHTMVPTPYARDLAGPVRQALVDLERRLEPNRPFTPAELRRSFQLAVRDVLEPDWLPPLVARLRREAPDVDLCCSRVSRAELEAELTAGTLDFAIDVSLPTSDAIRQQPLLRDELVVLARPDHEAIGRTLDLDTYLALAHVQVSSRRRGPGVEDLALARLGHRRRVALRCQSYQAAALVVRESDLLLTLAAGHARVANAGLGNTAHPVPWDMPGVDLHLYWHAAVDNDPASRWMRALLIEAARGRAEAKRARAARR